MTTAALLLLMAAAPALADPFGAPPEVSWRGLLDLRAARTSPAVSALRGGSGKTRSGGRDRDGNGSGDGNATVFSVPRLAASFEADLGGSARVAASAEADADPEAGSSVGLLEAYIEASGRRAPASGRARAGTFLSPLAGVHRADWSGAATLTPSAAATWTAEELRVVGAEAALGAQRGPAVLELAAGVFSGADQAGRALAARGWTLHDRTTRVGGTVTLPGGATYDPSAELDGRAGAYARLGGACGGHARFSAAYWDNGGVAGDGSAAPAASVWSTRLWDFSAALTLRRLTLEAQAMRGDSAARTSPRAGFGASSLTASWRWERWTAAARADRFHSGGSAERGGAWTTALHWDPTVRRRLSLEYARASSVGSAAAGRRAAVDQILQANARFHF